MRPIPVDEWKSETRSRRSWGVAMLSLTAQQIEASTGIPFVKDLEPGLGMFWFATAATATRAWLFAESIDGPSDVRGKTSVSTREIIGGENDLAGAIEELLEEMNLRTSDLAWIHPDLKLTPHALWRQDDHGHRYLVETFPSRADARFALREFESHHHKQFYWIEAAR